MPLSGMSSQVEERMRAAAARARDPARGGAVGTRRHLEIKGAADGDIAGRVITVLEGGSVSGKLDAERVVIHGAVRGLINAVSIAVGATARVEGEMRYATLAVESGARVEALCVPVKPAA